MAFGRLAIAVPVFCSLLLMGCSKSDENKAETQGQVVAHVGDDVITVQELDNEFRLANIAPEKRKDPAVLKRIMGDLVTRKYLAHQALIAKLDREPGVLLDILRSKELVMANAQLARSVEAKLSATSPAEIDRYIASNPSKFADRQLIAVDQITFSMGTNGQAVIDATRGMKSLDEIDQKLTALDVLHGRAAGSINSATIPTDLMSRIEKKNSNEVFFSRAGSNGVFFVVKNEQARPLDGPSAVNFARQSLRGELLKSEIGLATVAANFEAKYKGEYARLMTTFPQQPTSPQK